MIFCLTLLNPYALFSNQIKCYKLYLPTVFIGQEALKYVSESKYLGFSFSDSKYDTSGHCSIDVKVTLFQSNCTTLYCPFLRANYKKSTFTNIHVAFVLVFLRGAVQVLCMQITISAASRLC